MKLLASDSFLFQICLVTETAVLLCVSHYEVCCNEEQPALTFIDRSLVSSLRLYVRSAIIPARSVTFLLSLCTGEVGDGSLVLER
ncbi:uncharacterized protein C8Q71DRAFT_437338 [Rhodofomes roseus]|uniref:Secreted protein n=1 Tax=Rhodofomes roseus TaxID=34475 RepID=A0ABQ8KRQ7_9APHY|nr:uncharacterized protein C8Q71DRAFT_437338 [Rhodofomes roseus]KAH9841067.1 hypothetical protein C8Q71DRAFT_437338 [Rhodofomes roseus]